jgi:hypothetical protein
VEREYTMDLQASRFEALYAGLIDARGHAA